MGSQLQNKKSAETTIAFKMNERLPPWTATKLLEIDWQFARLVSISLNFLFFYAERIRRFIYS